jgi:hypothetical protein
MSEITIRSDSSVAIPIAEVEQKMLAMPQADCQTRHMFDKGCYVRELRMKAGTLAMGHYQKYDHLNYLIEGKVQMVNDDGQVVVLSAPMIFVAPPGRKVGYVLEDTVWWNIYVTDIKDVDLAEAAFLEKSADNLDVQAHMFAQQSLAAEVDRQDYQLLLEQFGVTETQAIEQVVDETDQTEMPVGMYSFCKAISPIAGVGMFATSNIANGEPIGMARVDGKRTPLGRYVNHSKYPNAQMVAVGDQILLVAIENIVGALGGQQGQEITVDYRQSVKLVREIACQQSQLQS